MHGSASTPPQVQPYDLSRPCPLRPEELSRLQVAAADFTRSFSALAGEYLGVSAQFHVRSVGRSDNLLSATGDSSVWVVASGLESELCPVWRFDWPLASDLVNAMVGCQGASRAPERGFTRLEGRLLAHLCHELHGAWLTSWPIKSPVPDFWRALRGSSDLAGPNPDEWAGVCLAATGPSLHGQIDIHIPLRLARLPAPPSVRDSASPPTLGTPSPLVRSAPVTVTVGLTRWRTSLRELMSLQTGALVDLGVPTEGLLPLCVGGTPRLRVRPGVHEGYLSVQVVGPLEP
ncbi:FliM/FliN family flagellar motor switch protein [bacterium]|nr:FliM/FliN family flagellar motor switch protein [bacterium]